MGRRNTVSPAMRSEYKIMGFEPDLKGKVDRMQLARALNWYNHFHTSADSKVWIVEYMEGKKKYTEQQIELIKQVDSDLIPMTLCSQARMLKRGAKFPNALEKRLQQLIVEAPRLIAKLLPPPPDRLNPIIADFDDVIDQMIRTNYTVDYDPSSIKIVGTKAEMSEAIKHYRQLLIEVQDPEAHKLSSEQRACYVELLEGIIACLGDSKSERVRVNVKPKRVKSAVQITAGLKYNPKCVLKGSSVEIVSEHPTKIVASTVVYTYHVSRRVLTKYVSNDDKPLVVRRTTIHDFDTDLSESKKVRKPLAVIPQLVGEGKRECAKRFDSIKIKGTRKTPSGRMDSNTLIVRTFK